MWAKQWPRVARAKAAHWAEGWGMRVARVPGTFPPTLLSPSLPGSGSIFKVAHIYYPGSQGVTGGCLKDTA